MRFWPSCGGGSSLSLNDQVRFFFSRHSGKNGQELINPHHLPPSTREQIVNLMLGKNPPAGQLSEKTVASGKSVSLC